MAVMVWSYFYCDSLKHGGDITWMLYTNSGKFSCIRFSGRIIAESGFVFAQSPAFAESQEAFGSSHLNIAGFQFHMGESMFFIIIPLWMPLLPLLAATGIVWYRPIRDRLRGKSDRGFSVMAEDSSDAPPLTPRA
ncbi:MAG: hypothetical protein H7144_18105 [Burkholderiales bacterium]|nr:hypothetical protein [Phycisphaerae bacterium]